MNKGKNKTNGTPVKETPELMEKVLAELNATENSSEWEIVELDEEAKKAICQNQKRSKKPPKAPKYKNPK